MTTEVLHDKIVTNRSELNFKLKYLNRSRRGNKVFSFFKSTHLIKYHRVIQYTLKTREIHPADGAKS